MAAQYGEHASSVAAPDEIYNFDEVIDRRPGDSVKWGYYGPDALPLWVADMDFRSPEPVVRALRRRVEEGVFGYGFDSPEFRTVMCERLNRLYGWQVAPEALLFVPGVVAGFNLIMRCLCSPGQGVLVQTPVYPPMLSGPAVNDLERHEMALTHGADGRYSIDMDAFEAAITGTTRLFMLCNPHNPTGRAFTPAELGAMAEVCLRHNVLICSDEIHCDLLFPGVRHYPIAALASEIEQNTVTLMAPSKTFNIAGLHCSVIIAPNPELRRQIAARLHEAVGGVTIFGLAAGLAAYRDGQHWLDQLLPYLTANRDFLARYIGEHLPGIRMTPMEATYLAWLDCRDAGIDGSPFQFFLRDAGVALNDGLTFGRGGDGFVRLNFGCARATLVEALERMAKALASAT